MNAPAESLVPPTLPTDLAAAHAMILAERQARIDAQAEALTAMASALAAKSAASSNEGIHPTWTALRGWRQPAKLRS